MVTLESPAAGSLAEAPATAGRRHEDRLLTGLPEVSWVEREGQHVVVTGTGELVNAPLLVLAGYTLVFAYLARRFFRWE